MRNSMREQAAKLLQGGLETAKRLGASAAKLKFSQNEKIGCGFENGRLKSSDSQQRISYSVEVLVNGRRGTASGNDLQDLDEIIARAVALGQAGSAAHFDAYPPPGPTQRVKTHSRNTLKLTREKMIESCQSIVDALKDYNPDLFIEAGAERSESEGLLVTSGGVSHPTNSTRWSLGSWVQRTEGTDMLFAGYRRGWRDLNEFYDPNVVSEHILEDLRHGEKIADAPVGETTAFICPDVFEMFLYPIELGISGRNVAKGDSPLKGRLGEQMLDPCLTIVDNPHRQYANGAAEIDADGIPTRAMNIFNAGVLENFLYDLDSGGLAGAAPTGHSGCRPYSPEVAPGETSSDELLASIEDGIYIKYLMGFGQSNIMNGDFSCNVALGYRIRKGEIVGRVKNTMAAGNIYELLKSGVRLSSDRDEILHLPYAAIPRVHTSTAT